MSKWREEWNKIPQAIRGLMWHIDKLDEYETKIEKLEAKNEEVLEKCQNLDDKNTVAIERIQELENQIFKMRNCHNCGNHDECFENSKGGKCEDNTWENWIWEHQEKQEDDSGI